MEDTLSLKFSEYVPGQLSDETNARKRVMAGITRSKICLDDDDDDDNDDDVLSNDNSPEDLTENQMSVIAPIFLVSHWGTAMQGW